MQIFHIAGETEQAQPVKPVHVTFKLQKYQDSVRVIALDENGKRIKDGNIVKIVPNEGVYLYHTVEPALGFPLDEEGHVVLLDENPHSST